MRNVKSTNFIKLPLDVVIKYIATKAARHKSSLFLKNHTFAFPPSTKLELADVFLYIFTYK
jgi:hypothetical protein